MYEGIMTALITPLNEEKKVDKESLEKLIEYQINNNVNSLLILGGTGEYTSLNNEQKKEVIDESVRIVNNRVPIIVGLIEPGVGNTIKMGMYAKKSGADALMIVTPYYVSPEQQGIIEYYKTLDQSLNMPILLYNIPHKTNVNMLPETVHSIVNNTKNIVGIKECTENFGQMTEVINLVGDKIKVLAGEEFAAVPSMIFGAKGAVMASANIIPDKWVELYKMINDNKISDAIKQNKEYFPLFKAIFREGNPGPLKSLLDQNGLSLSELNLPLIKPTEETKNILKNFKL